MPVRPRPAARLPRLLAPALLGLAVLATTTGSQPPAPALTHLVAALDSADGRAALWGVYLADARTGRLVYAQNETRAMLPASNQKVLTAATALDALGSAHRYRTPLLFRGTNTDGVLRGTLVVRGVGDPSFGSSEVRGGDPFRTWADTLAARGVRRIEGTLVGDDDAFTDVAYPEGWDVAYVTKQASRLIGIAASGLSYHDNLVVVRFTGTGGAPRVTTSPAGVVTVTNRVGGVARTRGQAVRITRPLGADRVVVDGTVPAGRGATLEVPVSNPTLLAVTALRTRLDSAGIDVSALQVFDVDDLGTRPDLEGMDTLAVHASPTLDTLLQVVGKRSNNHYAEQVFRSLGWAGDPAAAGARVKQFLTAAGVNAAPLSIMDGSGLSRKDYVTAEALGKTLVRMYGHRERAAFFRFLAAPGERTSTLEYRLADVPVRAKTGSLEYVRALSGYVRTAGGQDLAFVFLANNFPVAPYRITSLTDRLVRALAASGPL